MANPAMSPKNKPTQKRPSNTPVSGTNLGKHEYMFTFKHTEKTPKAKEKISVSGFHNQ